MKILIAFNGDLNPYVDVIVDGLLMSGCSVDIGTEKFWNVDLFDYDIVHIQWPETLFNWRVPSEIELCFLRRRLEEICSKAIIVLTMHNKVSHHVNAQNQCVLNKLYSLCESYCDVVIHLGEASRQACLEHPEMSKKRHVVIPIPVYDKLYAPYLKMTQEEAKRQLNIPLSKQVVLAFGNFRFETERQLVEQAFISLNDSRVCLLAPKWYNPRDYAFVLKHPMLTLRSAHKAFRARVRGMKLDAKKVLSDEDVGRYFAAADVVFLQRINELNSGNLPMAFLYRKVILGPDCGNIGYWCKITNNFVFDPKNPASVSSALRKSLKNSKTALGEMNYKFAINHWSTKRVGADYAIFYRSLRGKKN